jgi:hypothetical protein
MARPANGNTTVTVSGESSNTAEIAVRFRPKVWAMGTMNRPWVEDSTVFGPTKKPIHAATAAPMDAVVNSLSRTTQAVLFVAPAADQSI